ncbi:50S ribosomal protein L18a [Candidatus Bathyarchaeota archaeon]|nr:50S ribosomal protein L18a [Candidatus Bathyarchaeota archaeon]
MRELKIFRITGEVLKPNFETTFEKEVVALKPEHAIEKIYSELGSRHRVKRFHIKIIKVEEIKPEEVEDPIIKKMMAI